MFIYKDVDQEAPGDPARQVGRRWHAVAIVTTGTACAAARACRDRRYLSTEAPRLPLAGCDANCCDCRYGHFDDRRKGPRRAAEKGHPPAKASGAEQRARRGRRADDQAQD